MGVIEIDGTGKAIERALIAVSCLAWAARLVFVSLPVPLTADESLSIQASWSASVENFVHAPSWAERWQSIERYGAGGRILSACGNMAWGWTFPGNGGSAFGLSMIAGIVAAVALALAARNLFGREGFLLAFAMASLSPYLLNYTIRVLATMQMTMWICLALYFFSLHGWRLIAWLAGGLCLGLAFGSHYGAGIVVLALAAGLFISVFRLIFYKEMRPLRKVWAVIILPILGAGAAWIPLLLIESWARSAGQSYFGRFLWVKDGHFKLIHENLTELCMPGSSVPYFGPYGLWLRILFELEPLAEILFFAFIVALLRRSSIGAFKRFLLSLISIVLLGLLALGLQDAPARTWVSIFSIGFLGFGIGLWCSSPRGGVGQAPITMELRVTQRAAGPLDGWALAIAAVVLIGIISYWRAVSSMARLVFAAWPILILALTGLLLRGLRRPIEDLGRAILYAGTSCFLVGMWAGYEAKVAPDKAAAYEHRNPNKLKLSNNAIIWWVAMEPLLHRGSDQVRLFGPPVAIYPAACYEVEPVQLLRLGNNLRINNLAEIVSSEKLLVSTAYVDPPTSGPLAILPKVGEPDAISAIDPSGKKYVPRPNPLRGIELVFPAFGTRPWTESANKEKGEAEYQTQSTLLLSFPPHPAGKSVFECPVQAIEPYPSADIRMEIEVKVGGNGMGSYPIPVTASFGNFTSLKIEFDSSGAEEIVQLDIRLRGDENQFHAPVACYFRRPSITSEPAPVSQ